MGLADVIVSGEIDATMKRLRYAVLVEERGKMFLIALVSSMSAAERLATANVDDALPCNTVAVFKRSSASNQWELHGRARMTGDGGSEFVRVDWTTATRLAL